MMSLVSCFFRITITLLIYTLASLSAFAALALAQAPAPFEIRVVPQAEYAVAGQPFTYTVVITNVSQMPVKDVMVFTETPSGTIFAETHQDVDWLIGGVYPGETGIVGWNALEPIAPAQTITFELVVNVLPEMVNHQLVSQEYTIINTSNGNVMATSLPITIQVLATKPTVTPSPIPTSTATNTTTPTTTSSPISISIPTSTPQVELTVTNTPIPVKTSPVGKVSSSTSIVSLIFGLLVLGGGSIGLIWFFKRK
jgi:uncharacterized repeat protein (TIGR01451 family)